jgi:hypothetical protein
MMDLKNVPRQITHPSVVETRGAERFKLVADSLEEVNFKVLQDALDI